MRLILYCCAGSSPHQHGDHTLLQAAFTARNSLLLGLSALQKWSGGGLGGPSSATSASSTPTASSASSDEQGLSIVGQQTLSISGAGSVHASL